MTAINAFRESYTNSDPLSASFDDFSSVTGRLMRYRVNWAMYESTAYRKAHLWAKSYLSAYGLYRFTRNIYSPAFRLGDFWQSHIWGGLLDPKAGDGRSEPSSIPILCNDDSLRAAIGQLWKWSNWQTQKGIVSLHGPVLGDAVIKIVDDPARKRVYMLPIHPGTLYSVDVDFWGNVKGYVIEELRVDPITGKQVTYREVATRNTGDVNVYYQTFKDGALYDWSGENEPEWSEPYGFVPMVVIQHRNVGLPWGWSEMHSGLPDFREVDDQASLLNDQIRKVVNAIWYFSGADKPKTDPLQSRTTDTDAANAGEPEIDRQKSPALYGPVGSDVKPMVAPLEIEQVGKNIERIIAKIERDYPELSEDLDNASGDVSGRALRINRQPVITKVNERRPNYDFALVRAQQMAIAIGGHRKYEGFAGYDLESYAAGKLDHVIGPRPVYDKDPLDDIEVESAFWEAADKAKTAGIPLMVFLRRNGWTNEQIKELQADPDYMMRMEQQQASLDAQKALANAEIPTPGDKPGDKSNDKKTK
jgi:hypothetical protein